MMRDRIRRLLIVLAVAAGAGACATAEQWHEWDTHSTHFASNDHMFFSLRNRGQNPTPRVYKSEVEKARLENWWGEVVVVRPDQLFEG